MTGARHWLGAVLVVVIAATAAQAQDTMQSVSVTVAGTKSHGSDLTQAAIMSHGYAIESATDNAIVSGPSGVRGGWSKYRTVVHASILGVGADSCRVVISEWAIGVAGFQMNGVAMQPPQAPVTTKQKKEYAEMRAIRDAISATAGNSALPGATP